MLQRDIDMIERSRSLTATISPENKDMLLRFWLTPYSSEYSTFIFPGENFDKPRLFRYLNTFVCRLIFKVGEFPRGFETIVFQWIGCVER